MLHISKVSFPGLGIGEFDVNSVAFTIPGIDRPIMWYAILITFGMICCIIYTLVQARKIGITFDDVIDFALFTIPIGVIGARLYYVIFDQNHTYDNFIDVINISNGGLAIYGGIIAGTLTVLVVSYFKKINFLAFGDCVAPGVLLAQGIGRWGNFMNGEAYGSLSTGLFRMGLFNSNTQNNELLFAEGADITKMVEVHPTFLYESVWNLLGVLLVYLFAKFIKKKYDGQLVLMIFGWYGLGRMFIEGLRTDPLTGGSDTLRVSQVLAAVIFVVCLVLLIVLAIKKPTLPLYCKAPVEDEKKVEGKIEFTFINKIKELLFSKNQKTESPEDESKENDQIDQ
jgi:phosphatidylglycerol:prolipoprotein diacylglycerol transferase